MDSIRGSTIAFLCTYSQHKEFHTSNLWLDYMNEVQGWIEDIQLMLEQESDIQEIYRFQGRLQACREFLTIPQRILAVLEMASEKPSEDATLKEDQFHLDFDEDVFYTSELDKWKKENENG